MSGVLRSSQLVQRLTRVPRVTQQTRGFAAGASLSSPASRPAACLLCAAVAAGELDALSGRVKHEINPSVLCPL